MTTQTYFDLNSSPPREHQDFDLNEVFEDNTAFVEEEIPLNGDRVDQVSSKTNLTNQQREQVYQALLQRSVDGKPKRNTTKEVAALLSVNLRTVQRIWKRAKETAVGALPNVSHRRTKNCGRKRIEIDLELIKKIPLSKRTTVRSIGEALHVSHHTVHNRFKEGILRRHSNAIKPFLKEENHIKRLQFCISMLDQNSLPLEPRFNGMFNIVHIDEKWFYLSKKSRSFYLLQDEEEPLRSCQSKNFIPKVMFLTAIARPRYDGEGNEVFSGKIGVFPLVTSQPAKRNSKNRGAGTMETKPIIPVTKVTIQAFLQEKIIPAIQAKWPSEDARNTIFIQQDNARTHIQPTDAAFQMVASQNGFDIRLLCQPAMSPDMNVLDLGFFNAIQSLQDKECTKNVDELISAVQKAYDEYPPHMINRIFLTLQLCMRETMLLKGSNKYKIPHINKAGLERNGLLPVQVSCSYELVESTKTILSGVETD